MKALVTRSLIALVIVTGFTVTAEAATPVQPEIGIAISIPSSTTAVGVLAGR